MGKIRNIIRSIFGTATEYEAKQPADPNDLIALSRVSLQLETELGYEPVNTGGIAFSDVDSVEFEERLQEVKGVIHKDDMTEDADLMTKDTHGTQWIIVEDGNPESLASNLQYGTSAMESVDYSSRLLAVVVPFEKDGNTAYLIYSFKRGKFYPFVPKSLKTRDDAEEEKIAGLLREEIDVEENRSYWYPFWPRKRNLYPWE
jgi:hypothetical protein